MMREGEMTRSLPHLVMIFYVISLIKTEEKLHRRTPPTRQLTFTYYRPMTTHYRPCYRKFFTDPPLAKFSGVRHLHCVCLGSPPHTRRSHRNMHAHERSLSICPRGI